ncbi:hypothetical protein FRC10_003816 [Ceratobasidium sp. 414]|nr:hypothetical protein FRC10_003816 [Ceratobasidium sp. 414]
MELAHPARRSSRRQPDYRATRPDGADTPSSNEIPGDGNNTASSERVRESEEMIDAPPDSQSNKPRIANAGRTNKSRTVFTPEQLALLQDAFEKNPYPSREVREKLEEVTGLHPEPRASGLSSLASWTSASGTLDERPHRAYYPEDHTSSAPISHPGVPFPTMPKQSYSLDSYASRRNISPQTSSSASSAHGLQHVRSRPSLEWACAIERQRVRPYPKKPASREAGWSRHINPSAPGSRSRSHSHSAVSGPLNGHKEEDVGGSDTEPEEDDAHEVLTPPQSLMALERQARVQSFASAMSSGTSGYKYDSDSQADLDAAMILVGMGMS